jgi:hypothetical protein
MSVTKKFDRKRLREIVESYDGSLRSFDELKPDCYEQQLAAESLEQLDLLYSELFAPGRSLETASQRCPPWPAGSKYAGQQPRRQMLAGIFKRFQTERTLGLLVKESENAEKFLRTAKRLLPKERLETLDSLMTTMSQEIMAAKLKEIPVSKQLPPLDRLLTREKVAVRERERELKEKKLELENKKFKWAKKKGEEGGKEEGKAGAMTKEAWEELERDLKLI